MTVHEIDNSLLEQVLSRNESAHATETVDTFDADTIVEVLQSSTESVFSMMCQVDLVRIESPEPAAEFALSGVITISGGLSLGIVVGMSEKLARVATENMLGIQVDGIDSDVLDLVGEIANMIGGKAKEQFSAAELRLGLPTVVRGGADLVEFGCASEVHSFDYTSPAGALQVEIAIKR